MSRQYIFLLGNIANQITGNKLPSNGDCLRVLFYNMRVVNLNLNDSSGLVADECLLFWKKARIPTQYHCDIVRKIKNWYESWRSLDKNKTRKSATQQFKEKHFQNSLNNLFDIAHKDAFNIIKIDEDWQFLTLQRQEGRVGYMAGMDKKLCAVEERRSEREKRRQLFSQTSIMQPGKLISLLKKNNFSNYNDNDLHNILYKIGYIYYFICNIIFFLGPSNTVDFEESISSDDERDVLNSKESEMCQSIIMPVKKRGRKEIMTRRLASALDKCKISDRDAVHLLIACAEVFNVNVNDYAINRSSVKRSRKSFRYQISSEIKTALHQLNLNFAVVHWDSKILPNLIGTENVDRLAVIITAPNVEQVLGVPHLSSGTGKEISSALYDTLNDWNMLEKVQAFVFDTTASNSGRLNGSCVLLEQMLNRPILFLVCRHHIFEIILQTVFSYSKLTTMSGPEIPIFKRFKNN